MRSTLALILAGGKGERLAELCRRRTKPAVPIGGRYRLIDFTLSNCVNSGIFHVAVLAQYRPRSLAKHVGIGRAWDLDRSWGGVELLQPHLGRVDSDWYKGTADACYQNRHYVAARNFAYVLVLAGDHVYAMDYNLLRRVLDVKAADVVVATLRVPRPDAARFGTLELAPDGRIVDFEEKPPVPKSDMVSMGIYLFTREAFFDAMARVAEGMTDFGRHVIPSLIADKRVYCYIFEDYWRDVGTVDAYFDANMDLITELPDFNLYDEAWPIRTPSRDYAPARFYPGGSAARSLVAEGCKIFGTVRNSVIFPGVTVGPRSVIESSVVLDECRIGADCRLERAVIDKEVTVGDGCVLGVGDDYPPNRFYAEQLTSGLVLVGRESELPPKLRLARNACVEFGARAQDFDTLDVAAGEYVRARGSACPLDAGRR
ncbi:MAG TPA: sugar phosphate nucleotidyltransferase [bacterium]|nr:sugar phosphate nucleotidyltransferase [bacterium]